MEKHNFKKIFGKSWLLLFVSAVFLFFNSGTFAQENTGKQKIVIYEWLKVGNFTLNNPAFDSVENVKGEKFSIKNLLTYSYLDINNLKPVEKGQLAWKGADYGWEKLKAAKDDFVFAEKKLEKNKNQLAIFATYLRTDRWMKATVDVNSAQLFEVYLDGKLLTSKTSADAKDAEKTGNATKEVDLEKGKHLLIIKSLKPSSNVTDWKIKAEIICETR